MNSWSDIDEAFTDVAKGIRQAVQLNKEEGLSGQILFHAREFINRDAEMKKISDRVRQWRIVDIHGPPGVGKTALALRWIHHRARELNRKPIHVSVREGLTTDEIVAIVLADLDESRDFAPAREKLQALIDHMQFAPAPLLFDNCDSLAKEKQTALESLVEQLASVGCDCLLTSRTKLNRQFIAGFELAPLETNDAKLMLFSRARQYDVEGLANEEAEALCRSVGNLPLAIEAVAPLLRDLPLTKVIENVNKGHVRSLDRLTTSYEARTEIYVRTQLAGSSVR